MATVLPTSRYVPQSLRTWFLIHCGIDIIFGIPLLFFPNWVLTLFGFPIAETLTPRLVGAALLAIGGISFIASNASVEIYDMLLNFKIVWSTAALLGIFLSLTQGAPESGWIAFVLFAIFFGVWIYYKQRLWRVL